MNIKKGLYRFKYYVAMLLSLVALYTYAGMTGWKLFGSNSEKWQPEGQQRGYHK